jgi:hypothetical protein
MVYIYIYIYIYIYRHHPRGDQMLVLKNRIYNTYMLTYTRRYVHTYTHLCMHTYRQTCIETNRIRITQHKTHEHEEETQSRKYKNRQKITLINKGLAS